MNHLPLFMLLSLFFCHSLYSQKDFKSQIHDYRSYAVTDPNSEGAIEIRSQWNQDRWSGKAINRSSRPIAVKEIVLFDLPHPFSAQTPIYGESFQMLAQHWGTIANPADLGGYSDRKHYKIPPLEGFRTAYGLFLAQPTPDRCWSFAFTSCRKFAGRISFNAKKLRVSLETEGLVLKPGEEWSLEEFQVSIDSDREIALEKVAAAIQKNHPRSLPAAPPTGWCSWYTFYWEITEGDILRNIDFARKNFPELRYIQIDDGYQPFMGDWLETGKSFGGDIQRVLKKITAERLEPAIWVAPFIAEKSSALFKNHPDWFVKDETGSPLDSSKVSFGGWRNAPWYVLDGTHPAVQKHLEEVFRTMREKWGVTYFKLDANFWGAIHGGKFHDPGATRIEAYRRGMEAIQRGAGQSFILGCNAPIWPSLGLVDGMRTSGDIDRQWETVRETAFENLARSWQNGKLWWNDPDCLLLTENPELLKKRSEKSRLEMTPEVFRFHATALWATGGMILSGDELQKIPPAQRDYLKKLLTSPHQAMKFKGTDFSEGRRNISETVEEISLLNEASQPRVYRLPIRKGAQVKDFWTGERIPLKNGFLEITVAPKSGRALQVTP